MEYGNNDVSMKNRKATVFPETTADNNTKKRSSTGRNLYWFTGVPENYQLPTSGKKALQMQAGILTNLLAFFLQ